MLKIIKTKKNKELDVSIWRHKITQLSHLSDNPGGRGYQEEWDRV